MFIILYCYDYICSIFNQSVKKPLFCLHFICFKLRGLIVVQHVYYDFANFPCTLFIPDPPFIMIKGIFHTQPSIPDSGVDVKLVVIVDLSNIGFYV